MNPRRSGRSNCSTCAPAKCAASSAIRPTTGSHHALSIDLAGGDAQQNAHTLRRVLSGEQQGAPRDALLLGAALALEVTGTEAAPRLAIARAAQAIDSGAAAALLARIALVPAGATGEVASTEVARG